MFLIERYSCRVGQSRHKCDLCTDQFALSAALVLHKVKYHARDANGKASKLYTFFDDLINEETVYSSDEEFDYTFMIITSVMQTPKEYFQETEAVNELPEQESIESELIPPTVPTSSAKKQVEKATCAICGLERSAKNMRRHMLLIHTIIPDEHFDEIEPMHELTELEPVDLDLSEDIPLLRLITVPSDPTKAICQICGRERSARNMRRHMQLVHKLEINAKYQANIKGIPEKNIENEPIIDQLPGDMALDDPLDFTVFEADDSTIVKSEAEPTFDSVPKTIHEENSVFIKEEPFSAELLSEDDISLENLRSLKILQSDLRASHEKCPICLKSSNITNIRRHLIYAHKLSESEIKAIILRFCSRCSVCQKLMYTRVIKNHFIEAHNITDDAEIDRLNVNYWAATSVANLRQNKKPEHAGHTLYPGPNTSFQVFYQTKKSTATRKPKTIAKLPSSRAELPPLTPFQCRCPLCLKAGHHTNIKRHLKLVHKLSKWQISETLKLIDRNELPNQRPTTVRIPLKCSLCEFETSTALFMRLHNRSKHNSSKLVNFKASPKKSDSLVRIKCKVCYYTTTSPSEMQQHNVLAHTISLKIEQAESVMQSEVDTNVERSVPVKELRVPTLKPSYCQCPLCFKAGHHTNIKRHLGLVHKLSMQQIIEAIKLIDKNSLVRRSKTDFTSEIDGSKKSKQIHSSFECYVCKYEFRGEKTLRLHFNSAHLSEANLRTPVSLIERKRRQRNCTCALCKTEFPSRLLILTHFNAAHSDTIAEMMDERFDCDTCSRVSDSFAEYELHQHRAHIFKREQTPHLCNICGKYQQSTLALKMHLNTHNNTRHHACTVCNKRFTAKTTLTEHMFVHTGQKGYVCPFDGCDAAYAQRSGLTQHKILRHLENRHQCEYCGQKFPLLRYLK